MLTIVQRQSEKIESRLVRGFFLLLVTQLLLAAFFGPLLLFSKYTLAGGAIYYLLDFGSARASGNAFYFFGFPLALDARWLGVFLGMLCALLRYDSARQSLFKMSSDRLIWFRKVRALTVFLIVIPFTTDCFVGYLDRVLSAAPVFLVGSFVGLSLPFYLVPGVSACLVLIRKSTQRFFATSHRLRS
jgi:hypothetical protein